MIASDARIAANRLNAQKSTGPKSAEGKERSRANAVKHGMTGEGIALGSEEAAAVEARLSGFGADYRPVTTAGRALARRAAMLSVRLERCAIREAAAISTRARAAAAEFDEARAPEVEEHFGKLEADPAGSIRRLRRMPEGVDRLVATWKDLRWELARRGPTYWDAPKGAMASLLTGRKPGGLGMGRAEALSNAVQGFLRSLEDSDGAGLDDKARRDWARRELLALMAGMVAGLEAHRATLDLDAIAADRAGAGARALFDPSKEATLARKYEAAADREMHRALKEMKAVEAEAAAEAAAPAGSPAPLGSFSPVAPARPATPPPAPCPAPSASRSGADEGPTPAPIAPGRPEDGPR